MEVTELAGRVSREGRLHCCLRGHRFTLSLGRMGEGREAMVKQLGEMEVQL